MATQRVARLGRGFGSLSAAGFLLLNVGCGLMHPASARDGDPLLGNFNRPIVPTPSPTGADIGGVISDHNVYPAPAVGEGLRPPIPGAPNTSGNPYSGRISQGPTFLPGPTTTNAALANGSRSPKEFISRMFTRSDSDSPRLLQRRNGAAISLTNRFQEQKTQQAQPAWIKPGDPNEVHLRPTNQPMIGSGAAFVPEAQMAQSQSSIGPVQVNTIQEGQVVLASYGVKWNRLERVENEWQFTCGLGHNPYASGFRQYGARHPDQLGAVRAVLEQVRSER